MKNYTTFLDSFFTEIAKTGLDISGLDLDHVAYQAASSNEYDELKPEFATYGQEIHEEVIGGRRVAVFKLNQPLSYKNYTIPTLELIEPKQNQACKSAFQHAEFITDRKFEDYIAQYPTIVWDTSSMGRDKFSHLKLNFDNGLTLKFLHQHILELVG